LNDLWKYSAGQWTWMGGSNLANQSGIYGTGGKASSSNVPGARYPAVGWTDASGNLWLFGGWGYDIDGNQGFLNDLWKYGGGQWTWVNGSNLVNANGTYGTKGTASPGNTPGARIGAVGWTDASGNFWLFSGLGMGSSGFLAVSLNDLWKYSAGQWTWVSGSDVGNQHGVYGTLGIPSPDNVPGSADAAASWIDAAGNLWFFGENTLNDIWMYEP
jgi:hypothetical protein